MQAIQANIIAWAMPMLLGFVACGGTHFGARKPESRESSPAERAIDEDHSAERATESHPLVTVDLERKQTTPPSGDRSAKSQGDTEDARGSQDSSNR